MLLYASGGSCAEGGLGDKPRLRTQGVECLTTPGESREILFRGKILAKAGSFELSGERICLYRVGGLEQDQIEVLDPDHVAPRFHCVPARDPVQLGGHRRPLIGLSERHQALRLDDVARPCIVAGQGEGNPLFQRARRFPDCPQARVVVDPRLDVVLHLPRRSDAQLGRQVAPGTGHDLHQA